MKRGALALCMAALLALPAAGVFAGVGNGTMLEPPGLGNAEMQIVTSLCDQINAENADFDQQAAALEAAIYDLEPAIALGVPGAVDQQNGLIAQLAQLTDQHYATLDKLNNKLAAAEIRFFMKITAWQEKHGISDLPPK
jgi:hypothetical protein